MYNLLQHPLSIMQHYEIRLARIEILQEDVSVFQWTVAEEMYRNNKQQNERLPKDTAEV